MGKKKNLDSLLRTVDSASKKEESFKSVNFNPKRVNSIKKPTEEKINKPVSKAVSKPSPSLNEDKSNEEKKANRFFQISASSVNMLLKYKMQFAISNNGKFISYSEIVDEAIQEYCKDYMTEE